MFPNAERLSKEVISLPIYPSLKREEILYITTKLISILKE
jgi:dTDP-4-amino-4,6-dideoxygalactose transaminase